MEQIRNVIKNMINISDDEMKNLLSFCFIKKFKKKEILSHPGVIPSEIFFINEGIIRVLVNDPAGDEHTIHFALENQFIADYSCFIQHQPSLYTLQALEAVICVVMPRSVIEWGYRELKQGDKLGRLIAEFYFIYQDNRINNQYIRSPKERYNSITQVFPNIHNRVPQHMIASYLGITPIHLSRLKKEND
ncbi:Crp/Fnr family transcriptional regulator [Chryseotalea sanaruensis]|uniref:Crp/Fnr family transcriptional regulator n=1 Tax=Chryseotalea sanaruensis TaxID=2482724 RepID=A0A401UA53_9BACT|nr:Crp/Fnr family transcriptional regulator [Chryseotalea sanaruensis]GCC51760.1 Crp/Fnr family transcriptional regulator [Chryseotalea sanaruensis]